MKTLLKNSRLFLSIFVLLLIGATTVLCLFEPTTIHLALNARHGAVGDFFFRYYTYIGEGVLYGVVVLLLFYKAGAAVTLLASELMAGAVVQIVKHIVRMPRPFVVFDVAHHPDALPLVEGVTMRMSNSFPSGHTSTFFVLFLSLSILLTCAFIKQGKRGQWLSYLGQLVCLTMAVLGGYSRIYLSQHFLLDVTVGAVIGVAVTLLVTFGMQAVQARFPRFYDWRIPLHKR